MTKDVENLGMPLKGDLLRKLREIKDHHGIHNNTEIIRFLIKAEHKRIFGAKELP